MAGDVTSQHADYKVALPRWTKTEDAAAGEDVVKAKGDCYLPRPNAQDASAENSARWTAYLARAVYYNATGRTLNGLLGLAFDEDPELALPPAIDTTVREDVSGSGLTLFQHAQGTLAEILKTGRAGLLVDYPPTAAPTSKAVAAQGEIRPTVSFYPASAIINWRTVRRAGKTVLSFVVLAETHETADGFATLSVPQYRVLRFEGVYQVEIWRKVKDPAGVEQWAAVETYTPMRGDGAAWTELPFTFIGAKNNDWNVDEAPLYDIAVLNLAHYRNSADYEDSAYTVGQPQVWMAGLTQDWVELLEKKGVYFGSRAILPLPVNGSAGIMQAAPNTLAKEAMTGKEAQMAALGARLIQGGSAVKTATQQDSEDVVAHSVLSLCCENVSSAYVRALTWYSIFANSGETGIEFGLSTEFTKTTVDAQMLTALVAAVQAGRLPLSAFWERLRAAGLIPADKTDEQLQEEIDSQMPPGGAVNALGANDAAANGGGGDGGAGHGADGGGSGGGSPSGNGGGDMGGGGNGGGGMDPEMMAGHTAAMTALTQAITALATRPDPAAPNITVNMPEQPAPVVNIAPAAVTVESPTVNIAPAAVTVELPTINVAAPPPAQITVESPTINVAPPAITVESPNVQVDGPIVNVMAPKPMRTVPVRNAAGQLIELQQQEMP